MNTENLQPTFNDLIELIQLLVTECKTKRLAEPGMMPMEKWVAAPPNIETGVRMFLPQHYFFQKEDWFRAALQIFQKITTASQYQKFLEILTEKFGENHGQELANAVQKIIAKSFAGESFNSSDLLDFFLKSITNTPVPAWVDIDVYGFSLKGIHNVDFTLGGRRLNFRQLDGPDFEYEFIAGSLSRTRFGMYLPSSMLKIEMDTWRPYEFQIEAPKAMVMLRLFRVCSVRFGYQAWGTLSPFTLITGAMFAPENLSLGNHEVVLTAELAEKLQQFWKYVEPKLPIELQDFTVQKVTTISIAYERYCDSLLTNHPIERKITFAIMGLEAVFLDGNQELSYRLQLRICKALSKFDFKNEEIRSHVKTGYKIRSQYVHGGHLSEEERKNLEAKGIKVDELANKLLDYLRISILHLIISNQDKAKFLALLEDSFTDRKRDDELESIMKSEESILRI